MEGVQTPRFSSPGAGPSGLGQPCWGAPLQRQYRLVDSRGEPHPVLDDLYDSLDAAWSEAIGWWQNHSGSSQGPVGIGVEVSTTSGSWRTLRHPGC